VKRLATTAAIAVLAATLGLGLASPASAGGTVISVDPTSGAVGTTVEVTVHCGFVPGSYSIAFLGADRLAYTDVVTENSPVGAGPFVHQVQIPAVLDEGPNAPLDVVPDTYEFGVECDDFEVEAYVEFEVTASPTTTTEASTTTLATTTTAPSVAAQALRAPPAFTG
jgi:hypothetical protein